MRRRRTDGSRLRFVKILKLNGVDVHVRAHESAAGMAILPQQEMADFVGNDMAERNREKFWPARSWHFRDAVAKDVRTSAGEMRVTEHGVPDPLL